MKKWIAFWIVSLILCVSLSVTSYSQNDTKVYNIARVLLQEDLQKIQDHDYELSHQYYILGLDGGVISSSCDDYAVGSTVNTTVELQIDQAFRNDNPNSVKVMFPIEENGQITQFAIFLVPKNEVEEDQFARILVCFLPMLLWSVGIVIFMIVVMKRTKSRVFDPMEQMILSSEAIIKGDYTKELVRKGTKEKPDDKVEVLIDRFEMMRDELRAREQKEEKLKKSQKELMSCMSHDLRTPITTIQAHAEALRDKIVKTEEKKADYLDIIIRKSETVNRMIADLLDHSNAELNQMKLERKECYLKQYLDKLAIELETYCSNKNCHFEYQNTACELLINMDQGRMTQVIYNLIENACKYMNQRGTDNDEAKDNEKEDWIHLTCHQDMEEKRIYIEVGDNGPGIAMTDIPYVFDRFYRAEKSRSTQIPGAGLGLAICKYIVEQHGGEIMLQSKKGEGTQVTFYLNY